MTRTIALMLMFAAPTAAQEIIVTPGDLSTPYTVLGPVEWPEPGKMQLFRYRCDRKRLLERARKQYPSLNAIIGFNRWQDGAQERCGGTAVRITAAPTPTQPAWMEETELYQLPDGSYGWRKPTH